MYKNNTYENYSVSYQKRNLALSVQVNMRNGFMRNARDLQMNKSRYEKRKNDKKWICCKCTKILSKSENSDLSDDETIYKNTFNFKFTDLAKIMEQFQKTVNTVIEQNKVFKN